MYKTILVPLDLSTRAEKILAHVEDLALSNKANVVLLHVLDPDAPPSDIHLKDLMGRQSLSDLLQHGAEEYLAACRKKLVDKGISVQTRVYWGSVVDSIIKVAEESGADLIAMASHGRGGLAMVFYGSVAAGILHKADRPLLLIRSMEGESPAPQ
ncbi:MAG: universal stress protein [Chloroflexi bacterium]|nr:universal stress protein [Chloroflexota bacterium]MCL5275353.1 universal stress protein [Chloroflexota bacterium]